MYEPKIDRMEHFKTNAMEDGPGQPNYGVENRNWRLPRARWRFRGRQ
jgi:hypothetical protein